MSRSDRDRLLDMLDAISAIERHVERGPLTDGLVFDAVRAWLIEIGEAVKDVAPDLLRQQPHIPWRQVAAMRDQLLTATWTPRTRSSSRRSARTWRNSRMRCETS